MKHYRISIKIIYSFLGIPYAKSILQETIDARNSSYALTSARMKAEMLRRASGHTGGEFSISVVELASID
jgi:hypothetical protein